jgi:hypothetical protein
MLCIPQCRGVADFVERVAGEADKLWERYGNMSGILRKLPQFLRGRSKATFIRFTGFKEPETPVSMNLLKKVLSISKIPRGGRYLSREEVNQLIPNEGI